MNVALCNDNAFFQLDFALRTDQLAAGSARNIARFADNRVNADRARVGSRNLNL